MNAPDAAGLRDLAVSVALEAGRMLASRPERVEVAATKSSPTDVVTAMDRRSEELIRSRILAARPFDAILGEEGGLIGNADSPPVLWVVDPLDGTVNYLYGLHDWAVSIAAEVEWAAGGEAGGAAGAQVGGEVGGAAGGEAGRKIVAGAVYVPVRDEMFSAAKGGGARLESGGAASELHCNRGVPLDRALVGTGFGYLAGRRKVQGEVVAALLPQVRDIRRMGVASVDLCAVAAGRLDAFYERGLNYWDWAAGALVATESGAVVGGLNGNPVSSSMAVAAGPGLFGPLSAVLGALDPEHDA
ncbi:MAG: monophosphatase [Trebonia sp.]|nr:monophosphatase [Trebonia sp.]